MRTFIDLESRSTIDLTKTGVYVYAEHPSTEITLVCWAVDDDPVSTWRPLEEPEIPFELYILLHDRAVTLVAHNAGFERTMLSGEPGRRIGCPPGLDDLARWDCTAARAARVGLPRTLEGAGMALQLPVQKDKEGHRLMLQMCKPRRTADGSLAWWEDADRMDRLATYCVRDVETEREIDRRIPPLSAFERTAWEMVERLNDRGLGVDTDALRTVPAMVRDAAAEANDALAFVTDGEVRRVTDHAALGRWLETRGVETDGVDKAAVSALLDDESIPADVREALLLRQEAGKSSAAKYTALERRISADGRVRGSLVYCGAASTGRLASRGIQAQNLPRPSLMKKPAKVEAAFADLRAGIPLAEFRARYGPPIVVASELLRPLFVASPGRVLARGDSKQIEARVTPWLAGAERVLDAYRDYDAGTGPDLYKVAAGGIYGVDPASIGDEDARRQAGKVSSLALQFGGGAGALQNMVKAVPGLTIPRAERPPDAGYGWAAPNGTDEWIKQRWRESNPEIVVAWRAFGDAAMACLTAEPGGTWRAGRHVTFRRNAHAMVMRLPSGTGLVYWRPRVESTVTPWGATVPQIRFMAEDAVTKQWSVQYAMPGLWVQNATQAFARDLMCWWLLQGEAAGLDPVLSVHDEGIFEAEDTPDAAARVLAVMTRTPEWAAGLPVGADCTANRRYLKT